MFLVRKPTVKSRSKISASGWRHRGVEGCQGDEGVGTFKCVAAAGARGVDLFLLLHTRSLP